MSRKKHEKKNKLEKGPSKGSRSQIDEKTDRIPEIRNVEFRLPGFTEFSIQIDFQSFRS